MIRRLLLLIACICAAASAVAQISPSPNFSVSAVAPATPAVATVKAGSGYLLSIRCYNLQATPVYINLFNVVSGSITLGTTAASDKEMCPGNASGFVISFSWPVYFSTAINYSVSGGIALTDNTAVTASSVVVSFTYL